MAEGKYQIVADDGDKLDRGDGDQTHLKDVEGGKRR